jgi:acyl-coenzyme A thioesterase PaaI-like protein
MYEDAGLTHGEDEAELHCVTGNLNVDYLAPTPIDGPVRLEAHASGIEGRKIYVEGTLSAKGNITAKATGLFIKVDSSKSILD